MPTSLFKCFIGEIKVRGTKALLMDRIELLAPLISSCYWDISSRCVIKSICESMEFIDITEHVRNMQNIYNL